jgi:Transposase and inactivated derivatives
LYHVTSRGNGCEAIYRDEKDRQAFLLTLDDVHRRYHWLIHAYCLMDNHYHLLVETPEGNLSIGMRQLNGVFTQRFNRRHGHTGHIFQGRYHAILIQKESYLLELSRYIVLNPVRAGMVDNVGEWRWSSYRATTGADKPPAWLQVDWLLSQFGSSRQKARETYATFVQDGVGRPSPLKGVQKQVYLGDEDFLMELQQIKNKVRSLDEVPKVGRRQVVKSLQQFREEYPDRNRAMAAAYLSGAFTMKEIGTFFGVHYMTVSRAVKKFLSDERKIG